MTTGQSPSQVHSELTVTPRTGMGRFTYPAATQANMLLKLSGSANPVDAASGQVVGNDEVVGQVTSGHLCGASGTYTLHFAVQFNQPFAGFGTWQGPAVTPGARSVSDPHAGLYVSFDTTSQRTVLAKIGLSYVSDAGAQANLSAENPGWDFTGVQQAAHGTWNRYLGKIGIAGGSHTDQVKFYTALYHSLLHPNVFSDTDGQYMGFDGKVHTVPAGHAQYATYSGWDIYRSQIQLAALLAPQQASDMAQSLVNDYQATGELPKRPEADYESYQMVGDPADPIIADAYAFGARDFDTKAALAAMIHQATVPNNIRPGLAAEDKYGYLPMDASYGCCNFYGPVSTQLEYDTADYSIAAMAQALGDTKDYQMMAGRAQNWQNVFNPLSGFMQPKLSSGAWQPGFDPTSQNGFVEGDAYQYTPMVPFNLRGLITAAGGGQAWTQRLDSFFTQLNAGPDAPYAWAGNEPGLEIPWEYDYAGAPWHAQDVVRRIQTQLYTTTPNGEAGNDDLGAMSSWYVWSALGMYPETPGTATLALNSPVFPLTVVHLASGHTITINAPQAAPGAPYVQQLKLNGAAWPKTYLPPSVLTQGGTLQYTLGTTPNTDWATGPDAAPPSDPTGALPAIGYANPGQVTVQPGGQTAKLTLGARNVTHAPQKVTWTADVPSGIALSATSGTLDVPPSGNATAALTISAGHKNGQYPVTFHLAAGDGSALPVITRTVLVQYPFSLNTPTEFRPGTTVSATTSLPNIFSAALSKVTMTLTAPNGWTAQASGPSTFASVPPGQTASTTWNITIPSDAPAGSSGELRATATYTDADGLTQTVTADAQTVIPFESLTDAFNNIGITSDADRAPGDFDCCGNSYSYEALAAAGVTPGATVKAAGFTFTWPNVPAGAPDNVVAGGQQILVAPVQGATALGLLGAATNGPTRGDLTITYTDGTTQTLTAGYTDWTRNGTNAALEPGNSVAIALPSGQNVFALTIPLESGKTIQSVTLPSSVNQGVFHVFAIATQ